MTDFARPDYALSNFRRQAKRFIRDQQQARRIEKRWVYHNTFLGRRVERNTVTDRFRIIGGQVTVTA